MSYSSCKIGQAEDKLPSPIAFLESLGIVDGKIEASGG